MRIMVVLILTLGILFAGCGQQQAPAETESVPESEAPEEPEQVAPEEPEEELEEPEVADDDGFVPSSGTSIRMLGKEGFDPLELSVSVGTTVDFVNTLEKDDTLVFKKQGVVSMENTPKIASEASYSKTFDEAGTYEFWSVGYGPVGAKIIVE